MIRQTLFLATALLLALGTHAATAQLKLTLKPGDRPSVSPTDGRHDKSSRRHLRSGIRTVSGEQMKAVAGVLDTGSRAVADLGRRLEDTSDTLKDTANDVSEVRDHLRTGARVLDTGSRAAADLGRRLEKKNGTLKKVSNGLKTVSAKTRAASKTLKAGARKLNTGVKTLLTGSRKATAGARTLANVQSGLKTTSKQLTTLSKATRSNLLSVPKTLVQSHVPNSLSNRQSLRSLSQTLKQSDHLLKSAASRTSTWATRSGKTLASRSSLLKNPKTLSGGSKFSQSRFGKSVSSNQLVKKAGALKSGGKFLKGGAVGMVAEDIVGIDPLKAGKTLVTNPKKFVQGLAPKKIDQHIQKQATNFHNNYLKFGHVKKAGQKLDSLTNGGLSKAGKGLDTVTGGHFSKAGKTVGKTWNQGVDGAGKVVTTGYKGVTKGISHAGKAVGNAGRDVGKTAKKVGVAVGKAGKNVGRFVGGIFKKRK